MGLVALERLLAEIWSQHTRLSWGLVCQCGWVSWHSAQEATGDYTESFLYVVSMQLILNYCSLSTPTTPEAVCFLLSSPRELMGKLLMRRESAYSILINIKCSIFKKFEGDIYFIYISVFSWHVCLCTMCVVRTHRGQKRGSDPLQLE